jgi:Rps23 Pro-64 3,4-dihydroxylase Tpa1-like proline 4-hydroxylase
MIRWPGDLKELARAFRSGKPFPHAVVDGILAPVDQARVAGSFADEPMALLQDEIYLHLRSSEPPVQPALRELRDALVRSCAAVAQICGTQLSWADGAAYVYAEGHYLLPHSDSRPSEGRAIAYAYYAAAPERGGELQLFACRARRGQVVRTDPAKRIAARANRLVLFAVSELALHEVREVTGGARLSLAGWFYP